MSKIDYALATAHEIYRAPLEALFITIMVYREMGLAGLVGALLLLAFVPFLCEFEKEILDDIEIIKNSFFCSLYRQKVII